MAGIWIATGDHIAIRWSAQGKLLKDLDDKLNSVYKLALAALPEKDEQDIRKGREQLRKSQRAWLAYVRAQCDLEGGLQGGSNSWVSTFSGLCQEKESTVGLHFCNP